MRRGQVVGFDDQREMRLLRWVVGGLLLAGLLALAARGADGPSDPYLRAVNLLATDLAEPLLPRECVAVEDSHWGLESARTAGLRGFVSLGHVRAVYIPPPAGGLFLDQGAVDAITGGPFLIDHDQKLQAQGSLLYDLGAGGFWVGTNVRYDSGLVSGVGPDDLLSDPDNAFAAPFIVVHAGTDLDPNRIKARTIVDFSIGADLQKYSVPLSIQADLLNARNTQGVYNIESVFGGTHVIPPRMLAVRVRYTY